MKNTFTILVADKNRHVRDFLRRELSAAGYDVLVARDGVEVLAAIETNGPLDLLVLDLEVPDADSSRILEKAQTRRPPLPVVIHTFLTEESERDMPDAAETYIEKSGNIDHLKSAIAEILKRYYPDRS